MKHEKKRNANDKAAGTPVRITMKSSRRETQARLFEASETGTDPATWVAVI